MQFGLFGDGCRFLVIDERCPHDRVYEVTHREPLAKLEQMIPVDAEIGHAGDGRQEALVGVVMAAVEGRPHLAVAPSGGEA